MANSFVTIVTGITKKNLKGQKIQTILKEYVKENYDTNRFDKDDYDYWTNEEIELEDEKIYQYDLEEGYTISLIPQPDNPYDPNAIMVHHKQMGMIGYIPKEDNVKLAKYIKDNNNQIKVKMQLEGGPYKYYDDFSDSVKKSKGPYYIRLFISPLGASSEKSSYEKEQPSTVRQPYQQDLFERLATSDQPYQNVRIKKEEPISKTNPVQKENNTNNKANKYKNPLVYLTGGIVFIILAILLIITKNYILSIIPVIASIFYIKIYIDSKNNKDGQK